MIYQDKVYGEVEINEASLLDVMNSAALQRLKGVNQYGTWVLVDSKYNTTRFEHSVGVAIVLKHLGADLKEQLAGLIHDVAHTAFSHVVDYVFAKVESQDFHEAHAAAYVARTDLPKILQKYNYDWRELIDEERFSLLEKKQPAICADRIDYFLRDGLTYGLFGKEFIRKVLASLKTEGTTIYYDDVAVAREAAEMHFRLGEFWASPMQSLLFLFLSKAMRIGLDAGVIVWDDLWLTDDELLAKLRAANNTEIDAMLEMIKPGLRIQLVDKDWDYEVGTKARFSDPLVKADGQLKLLSALDPEFKQRAENFVKERRQGFKIKIIN